MSGETSNPSIDSISTNIIRCADCGTEIEKHGDTKKRRVPCSKCSGTKRNHYIFISNTVIIRDGIGLKVRRAGEKKPYVENLSVPDYSRSLDKIFHRARIIDRDNDRYVEKITDYESGEVVHCCEEPLSQHQRHGNAKPTIGKKMANSFFHGAFAKNCKGR